MQIIHYDLFAGIGGFSYALDKTYEKEKIKHIFVEIDPFCQAVLKKHWPEGEFWGDIRDFIAETKHRGLEGQINEKYTSSECDRTINTKNDQKILKNNSNTPHRDGSSRGYGEGCYNQENNQGKTSGNRWGDENSSRITILTGGFPCFTRGTRILTIDGYKPIESISVGDIVLTHKRNWKRVKSIMVRKNAPVFRLEAQGSLPIFVTKEHPFWARKRSFVWNKRERKYQRFFSNEKWIEVKNLTKDYFISQTTPSRRREDKFSKEFWWLVGRYLADGWRVRRKNRENSGRVIICCNRKEREELYRKIIKAGFHPIPVEERTVTKFHICNVEFYRFLEQFGYCASGKTIPGWVFEIEREKCKSLLDGYISGDGYIEKDGTLSVTTTSKELALSVVLLAQHTMGVVASIRECKMSPVAYIEGRKVNQRNFYTIRIPKSNHIAFIQNGYGWKKIRKIEFVGEREVFNLSVEDDESYIAENTIVHNCQPFSQAGQRKGTTDDRYLWGEMFEAIRIIKPDWVVAENVRGLITIQNGVVFEGILSDLESEGYAVQALIIPACAVGAPHRRDRVWIIAQNTKHDRSTIGENEKQKHIWNKRNISTRDGIGIYLQKDAPHATSRQSWKQT
jgi:site-specific DNA-cytosine methylase